MVLALTTEQLDQITTAAQHVPRHLRSDYLRLIAEALAGRDFGDGDVHRAIVRVSSRPADNGSIWLRTNAEFGLWLALKFSKLGAAGKRSSKCLRRDDHADCLRLQLCILRRAG